MKVIVFLLTLLVIIDSYVTAVLFYKKNIKLYVKVYELLLLFLLTLLCLYGMELLKKSIINKNVMIVMMVVIIIFIIKIGFNIFKFKSKLSVFSVKEAIDLSPNGIMFINKKEAYLVNQTMKKILDELNIKDNYIENLCNKSNKKYGENLLICLDKVWQLKYVENQEIILMDVTDIYNLEKQIEEQNKKIILNNNRIRKTLINIEKFEREKNLIKIKNEFHDVLGYQLSLFQQYLNKNEGKVSKDILKNLIDNIYDEFKNEKKDVYSQLTNLINIYNIFDININLVGNLPIDNQKAQIFFEIIRESITNAIIHAKSRNIDIDIKNNNYNYEMIISNDGDIPENYIMESDGIKGMRRKLDEINGYLEIKLDQQFVIKVHA